jgi:SAM-dependent methyltransferase
MNCPVCSNKIEEDKFLRTYVAPFNNQEYKLFHCLKCDIQFWDPLKIIPEFYENEGAIDYKFYHEGKRDVQPSHRFFLNRFKHYHYKANLLDVGCADGVFLKEAQKIGFEVYGIDFDSKSIKIAKEKFGLKNTFAKSLKDFYFYAKEQNLKFDVITFFDVLEHQDNPNEFIFYVKEILNPNGYIAGSVPNRNGKFIYFYRGKFNNEDFPPHHFLWFSQKALQNFFDINGFKSNFLSDKNTEELVIQLEMFLTGKAGNQLKVGLKSNTRINWLQKSIPILKILRKFSIYPLAYLSSPILKGSHFYFEAQLK